MRYSGAMSLPMPVRAWIVATTLPPIGSVVRSAADDTRYEIPRCPRTAPPVAPPQLAMTLVTPAGSVSENVAPSAALGPSCRWWTADDGQAQAAPTQVPSSRWSGRRTRRAPSLSFAVAGSDDEIGHRDRLRHRISHDTRSESNRYGERQPIPRAGGNCRPSHSEARLTGRSRNSAARGTTAHDACAFTDGVTPAGGDQRW